MRRRRRGTKLVSTMVVLLAASLGAYALGPAEPAQALNNGVAPTPPMGWNSYDSYNWNVTEAQVRANADYMRDNLRQFGWALIPAVALLILWEAGKYIARRWLIHEPSISGNQA